jgi:hypothetical protein
VIPDWWTPAVLQQSREHFELMHRSPCCGTVLEDLLHYKFCLDCKKAYSPVPDYGALELEEIADALAGD